MMEFAKQTEVKGKRFPVWRFGFLVAVAVLLTIVYISLSYSRPKSPEKIISDPSLNFYSAWSYRGMAVFTGTPVPKHQQNQEVYLADLSKGKIQNISSSPDGEYHPRLYGDYIVYEKGEVRDGKLLAATSIYLYDLQTRSEGAISSGDARKEYPFIQGKRVVWQDKRNGNWDIFLYDIDAGRERAICTHPARQTFPYIYGDRMVWQDNRNGKRHIYLYDLSPGIPDEKRERRITTSNAQHHTAFIYKDLVVWQEEKDGSQRAHAQIYAYNIKTGKTWALAPDTSVKQFLPVIAKEGVIWFQQKKTPQGLSPTVSLCLYDLKTEKLRVLSDSLQHPGVDRPTVSDLGVLVSQQIHGPAKIYLCQF